MKNELIIANWKMNPLTEKEAINLACNLDFKNLIILPPFIYLKSLKERLKKAKLGVQNFYFQEKGAFTGEISFYQLKKIKINYYLIGHSERREIFKENNNLINLKLKTVIKNNKTPIYCCGEKLNIRKKGKLTVLKFLKNELESDFKDIKKINNLILAYEPIWSVNTNRFARIDEIDFVLKFLKNFFDKKIKVKKMKIVYGGAVDLNNFKNYLNHPLVDGLLVGRFSLKKDFKKIFDYE